jgi:hypothetical protein
MRQVTERRGTWSAGAHAVVVRAQALRAAGGLSAAGEIRATLDRVEELARRGGTPNHVPLALLERAALAELEGELVRAARP